MRIFYMGERLFKNGSFGIRLPVTARTDLKKKKKGCFSVPNQKGLM